jgi:RNA polymerase sigma-70 factor (ECF subfamily)
MGAKSSEESVLAAKAAAGDLDAFGELVGCFQKPVYGFLFGILRSVEDTEDAAQETFLRAYRAIGTYDPKWRFNTWLFTIARNVAFNLLKERLRKGMSRSESDLNSSDPVLSQVPDKRSHAYEQLVEKRFEEALLQAVAKLPPKLRAVFHLRHREQMKLGEIAKAMGMSESNVKVSLHRARRFLKSELEEWLE